MSPLAEALELECEAFDGARDDGSRWRALVTTCVLLELESAAGGRACLPKTARSVIDSQKTHLTTEDNITRAFFC